MHPSPSLIALLTLLIHTVLASKPDLGTCTPSDTHLIIGSLDATRPTILLGGPSNPTLRSPSLIFSIITTFLCDRLEKECGAPMETVRVCRLAMRQPLFMENARGG
ncbi:hypothetical protein BC829DRAFT_383252, partial [Chytridium lagenaria]